ncbi:hypothetical protein MUB24_03185 [Lederbergia sp. NSJ-179]|uniref:hypothetical protein n=1 Tax=Lederbergia sp. NSJ-179 TaxID=2931402 RepID=UPI001FD61692|nr:hypothetical protein [Lederbergia sp. NSJ-179]MCJ7839933.1 hypothetical protein [Lederbergia sp. NSJ-179]
MKASEKNLASFSSATQLIQMNVQSNPESHHLELQNQSIYEEGLALSEVKAWKKSLHRS